MSTADSIEAYLQLLRYGALVSLIVTPLLLLVLIGVAHRMGERFDRVEYRVDLLRDALRLQRQTEEEVEELWTP
jgi:hypothetical protein